MAKRNIKHELQEYFRQNINARIERLTEEIAVLREFRSKIFTGTPKIAPPVVKIKTKPKAKPKPKAAKPKRTISEAHKRALAEGRKRWALAQKGQK